MAQGLGFGAGVGVIPVSNLAAVAQRVVQLDPAARHVLNADLAVVTQGPGNLGTGTPWGFSGVAAGEACNAVTVLGGEAIALAWRGREGAVEAPPPISPS